MKIYLIGYMASGKTNLGREMAEVAGFSFIDLDELFEEKYKVSILEFFEKYGEDLFRKFEQEILLETAAIDNAIISTGGGTPCFFDNMDFIQVNGRSVYLKMPVSLLAARLSTIRRKRPLLKDVRSPDMEDHVARQLKERESFYLRADVIANGPEFDAGEIVRQVQSV